MRRGLKFLAVFGILATLAIGCTSVDPVDKNNADTQRQNSVATRVTNFARAEQKYPQPIQENFPMREALLKYTQRQDLVNHPWYIYVSNECFQCPGGITYQYYIGQTYPQSTCNFLGSTEDVKLWEKGETGLAITKVQAPSLDGIYYGSGATTGGCDYFFFDVATDALMVIHHDWRWFTSDHVLLLEAKLVKAQ